MAEKTIRRQLQLDELWASLRKNGEVIGHEKDPFRNREDVQLHVKGSKVRRHLDMGYREGESNPSIKSE